MTPRVFLYDPRWVVLIRHLIGWCLLGKWCDAGDNFLRRRTFTEGTEMDRYQLTTFRAPGTNRLNGLWF